MKCERLSPCAIVPFDLRLERHVRRDVLAITGDVTIRPGAQVGGHLAVTIWERVSLACACRVNGATDLGAI